MLWEITHVAYFMCSDMLNQGRFQRVMLPILCLFCHYPWSFCWWRKGQTWSWCGTTPPPCYAPILDMFCDNFIKNKVMCVWKLDNFNLWKPNKLDFPTPCHWIVWIHYERKWAGADHSFPVPWPVFFTCSRILASCLIFLYFYFLSLLLSLGISFSFCHHFFHL